MVDCLEVEVSFTVAANLEGSGFLVAADAVAIVGFLAAVVEGGLLTSFFAAGASLFGSCAAAGLPADGAVVTREAAVLPDEAVEEDLAPAEGGLVVAVGLDVVK